MDINSITGGKWWKFDFHLHTPASYDYGRGDESQKNTEPLSFLKKCMNKELDCIVITDHNDVSWIPLLRNALEQYRQNPDKDFRELVIFPGVEITVQGNIHMLGIFDPSIKYEDLVKLLGKIDYDDDLKATKTSIADVIDIITTSNGIAIPAHVDQPSGLFYETTSSSLQRMALDTGKLLALEVIDNDFFNSAYTESKQDLSYVAGSDAHTTTDIAKNYTWVKMGEANIEALRLALFDSKDSTIRSIENSDNPNSHLGRTFIKSVEISSGKIIGRVVPFCIQFSPWHNCLIGGRGSGKSSILKFIRLILNRQHELPEDLASEFVKFAKIPENREDLGVLLPETEIVLEMVVDGVENKLLWKNGKTYEIKDDGTEIECIDILKRFPVKMFSQKQLLEYTKNTRMLMDYIDEDWDCVSWKEKYDDLKLKYVECKNGLIGLRSKQLKREQILVQLEDLQKKISVFETNATKQLLVNQTKYYNQKDIIGTIYNEFADLISVIESIQQLNTSRKITSLDAMDKDTQEQMNTWINALTKLQDDLQKAIQSSSISALSLESLLQQLPLNELIIDNNQKLNDLLSTLSKNGIQGIDQYKVLIEQREQLQTKLVDYPDVKDEIASQEAIAETFIITLKSLIKQRYEDRCRVIDQYNSNSSLRISLHPFNDIDANEQEFRRIIHRTVGFDSDILLRNRDNDTPTEGFIYRCCCFDSDQTIDDKIEKVFSEKNSLIASSEIYAKKFIAFLEKERQKSPEIDYDTIFWVPDDRISLEIKLQSNRFQSIDSSSSGQRASAILSLILQRGKYPIIIDQPEDDLDTRNITDIVVKGIIQRKEKHQFIIVTHNPNIVVNTNSEQIIQLDFKGGQIQTQCSGALQRHEVRDAICEIMEGGREALEKRYYRIIKALSN